MSCESQVLFYSFIIFCDFSQETIGFIKKVVLIDKWLKYLRPKSTLSCTTCVKMIHQLMDGGNIIHRTRGGVHE